MKLSTWIDRSDFKTVRQFAAAAGLHHDSVYKVLNGEPAGGKVARAIYAATGGKVRIMDVIQGRAA